MSQSRICLNIERPDLANLNTQGHRGPFAPILGALELLTKVNLWQLLQKDYPPLYESGIYYKSTPPAVEWHDIPSLLKWGFGDCKDLVAYRVAELIHYEGVKCRPCIKWKFIEYPLIYLNGKWEFYNKELKVPWHIKKNLSRYIKNQKVLLIHVLVEYPDGTIEDPSKILGMGGEYT